MLNNPKIKPSSAINTYQKFFNTNYFSTSKEKLYTNIPRNIKMYNNTKEAITKSPDVKSSSKKYSLGNNFFNIGNRLININYSEKQPINTSENKFSSFKTNSLNNVRYSNNPNVNQTNKIKLETEADKNNKKSDFVNSNLFCNYPNEINNFEQKETIKRHSSITQRTSNKASFREFVNNII